MVLAPQGGKLESRMGRLDIAVTSPVEDSGVSGSLPTANKDEGAMLVRDRVRLVRSGRGVAG